MTRRMFALSVVLTAASLLGALGCAESPAAKKARHLERGERYFTREQYREAIIEYRNVLRLDPGHAEAVYRLGVAYQYQGEIAEAYHLLLRARELDPGHLDARQKLGAVYLVGGKPDEAKREAEFVLERDPAHVDALLLLARRFALPKSGMMRSGAWRRRRRDPARRGSFPRWAAST